MVSGLKGDRVALNKSLATKFDGRNLDSIRNGTVDFRRLALLVTAKSAVEGPGAARLGDYLRRDGLSRIDLRDHLRPAQRKAVLDVLQRASSGSKRIAATGSGKSPPRSIGGPVATGTVVQAAALRPKSAALKAERGRGPSYDLKDPELNDADANAAAIARLAAVSPFVQFSCVIACDAVRIR